MPPKAKGKATAGAAAALTSAVVGVEKFTRIKHGDLQHEADVKRSFSAPGSYWWGDESTDDEQNQLLAAEIVEVTLTRKLQGTSMKQPALRFVLTGAASSTVDESPLWISVGEYSKLTEILKIIKVIYFDQEKDKYDNDHNIWLKASLTLSTLLILLYFIFPGQIVEVVSRINIL